MFHISVASRAKQCNLRSIACFLIHQYSGKSILMDIKVEFKEIKEKNPHDKQYWVTSKFQHNTRRIPLYFVLFPCVCATHPQLLMLLFFCFPVHALHTVYHIIEYIIELVIIDGFTVLLHYDCPSYKTIT